MHKMGELEEMVQTNDDASGGDAGFDPGTEAGFKG